MGKNKINNFNLFFFEAAGFSMWPFIKQGDRLIVKKISIDSLRVGDVILYRSGDKLVCHRLVRKIKHKGKYLLYARGDNGLYASELVRDEMVNGKVTGVFRGNKIIDLTGRWRRFINYFIVLFGPCLGIGSRAIKGLSENDQS